MKMESKGFSDERVSSLSSGLEELHKEKLRQDQKINLRKILIWFFVFGCIYITFTANLQQPSVSVQVSPVQQTILQTEKGQIQTQGQTVLEQTVTPVSQTGIQKDAKRQNIEFSGEKENKILGKQQLVEQVKILLQRDQTVEQKSSQSNKNPSQNSTLQQI